MAMPRCSHARSEASCTRDRYCWRLRGRGEAASPLLQLRAAEEAVRREPIAVAVGDELVGERAGEGRREDVHAALARGGEDQDRLVGGVALDHAEDSASHAWERPTCS